MDDECVICLNSTVIINEPDVFNKNCKCKYTFHDACLKNWLYTNPSCPICREVLLIKSSYVEDQNITRPSQTTTIDMEILPHQIREHRTSNGTIIFTERNRQNPCARFYSLVFILSIIIYFALKP